MSDDFPVKLFKRHCSWLYSEIRSPQSSKRMNLCPQGGCKGDEEGAGVGGNAEVEAGNAVLDDAFQELATGTPGR